MRRQRRAGTRRLGARPAVDSPAGIAILRPGSAPAQGSSAADARWQRAWSAWSSWGPAVRRIGTVLLIAWFAWHTYARISFFVAHRFPAGIDATIYYRGVVAWLHGTDPWAAAVFVGSTPFHYAGSPVTTVLMAPAALLGEHEFTIAWLVLTWAAAIWTLRRLRLPLWWLLFPPLAEALFSANPQIVVLALLVSGNGLAAALATGLKVYAFIPLAGERRWRQLVLAVAVNAATILVAPALWVAYVGRFGAISSRLAVESLGGLSAYPVPLLLAVTCAALALLVLVGRELRTAGWLAVPAIWPSSQFHYSTMALPVMTPFLAVLLAVPQMQLPAIVISLEVGRRLLAKGAARWIVPARPAPAGAPAPNALPVPEPRTARIAS